MKHILAILTICLCLAGCKTVTAPAPPPAPGYLNSQDQMMGEVLTAAHSFYSSLRCATLGERYSIAVNGCVVDQNATKFIPSPTEKTAINTFGLALNSAQTAYTAYHQGQTAEADAQNQVDSVSQQQVALQSAIGVKQ
jgi:hypothetical protein